MDAQETIEKRWGCRKYLDKSIEKDKIGMILDAGRLAPSAGNLQDRSFIVVKDDKKKELIAQACGNQTWMQSAPIFIVVLSENKKLGKFFGQKGEKIYSIQDTSFSVENMLLSAVNLGLGCSLVVGFSEEKLNDVLEIQAPAQIHAVITVGYAAEPMKQSSKYPLEKFVYFDKYGERVENVAAAFGEWSIARKEFVVETAKTAKRETKGIMEKIKLLFKKKEAPKEDHFLEEPKTEVKDINKQETEEIPRYLPK